MLRQGSRGAAVSALQQQLRDHGFDPGPIDGVFGPRTLAAVRAFQTKQGIAVDGVVGPITNGRLGAPQPAPAAPAAPGSAGPAPPVDDAAKAAADALAVTNANAQAVVQQDAFARIQTVLGQYDISGLGDWLWGEIKANNPESQIMLDLQNQPAFMTRFPGLKAMRDAGLPAVTPAAYLATEREYKRQLAEMGFDTKQLSAADFVPLFKSNLDPSETRNRLDTFHLISTTFSPHMRQDFLAHAGINLSDQDLYNMFHGLDPTLAMKYATATGTTPPSPSDFHGALAGMVGPSGNAPVSLASVQDAERKATEDEKALFHSFSSAGAMDKAIDTAPASTKNF